MATLPSIDQLEGYLENVLRKKHRDAKDNEIVASARVEEVRNLISYLSDKLESKNTIGVRHYVDVGSEIYLETNLDDMSYVHVEMVHGFYVTMLLSEAIAFLQGRLELLQKRRELATKVVAHTKTSIKCFLEALDTQIFNT